MVGEVIFALYLIAMYFLSVIHGIKRRIGGSSRLNIGTYVAYVTCLLCFCALIFLDLKFSITYASLTYVVYLFILCYTHRRVREYFDVLELKKKIKAGVCKLERELDLIDNAIVVGKGKHSKSLRGTDAYLLLTALKVPMIAGLNSLCTINEKYDIAFYAGLNDLVNNNCVFADVMLSVLINEDDLDLIESKFSVFAWSAKEVLDLVMGIYNDCKFRGVC